MKSKQKDEEIRRIPTAKLLQSKALSKYQKDFAKALLTEPEYSIEEATTALDKALTKKVKGV